MPRLYKERFFLALYDKNDNFLDVVDNCNQLSAILGMSYRKTAIKLWSALNKKHTVDYKGIRAHVFLIEADKEELKYVRN